MGKWFAFDDFQTNGFLEQPYNDPTDCHLKPDTMGVFLFFVIQSKFYQNYHQKLRTATYTGAVCKFRGGLVYFRMWHSSAQPFII